MTEKRRLETEEDWERFMATATDEELRRARDLVWQMTLKEYAKRGLQPPTPPWEVKDA